MKYKYRIEHHTEQQADIKIEYDILSRKPIDNHKGYEEIAIFYNEVVAHKVFNFLNSNEE